MKIGFLEPHLEVWKPVPSASCERRECNHCEAESIW